MSRARPVLDYPTRTAAVMDLTAQGLSDCEIAEKIGVSTNLVSALRRSSQLPRKGGWLIRIDKRHLDALRAPAAARGIRTAELVRRIVRIVAEQDLVDAVLDDGDRR